MARKRPKGSATPSRVANFDRRPQDYDPPANRLLPSLFQNPSFVQSTLSDVEDDRSWNPDRVPRARQVRRRVAAVHPRKTATGYRSPLHLLDKFSFVNPRFVIKCVRRKIRKSILHAMGQAGKGSGRKLKGRKYRRTAYSNIGC